MKKKILALALLAVSTGGLAWGATSLSLDTTFATNYVFRGQELGDQTLHPSAEITSDEYYLGFWSALPITHTFSPGRMDGWTNEYDFYAGYQPKLSDTVTLDIGATAYYYTQANLDSTTEGYVGITGDMEGFTPGVYVYYDFDKKDLTIQGNLGYSVPLTQYGTSLDLSGSIGVVRPDEEPSYTYYGANVVMPYKISEKATISVGAHWASNNHTGWSRNHVYYTLGATIGL
jgi:uncharacterized protein (TIGR02001 family)